MLVPRYTRSIDDALTLVPDGNYPSIKIERNWSEYGRGWHVAYRHQFFGHAPTPAIAICIAALKARVADTRAGKPEGA